MTDRDRTAWKIADALSSIAESFKRYCDLTERGLIQNKPLTEATTKQITALTKALEESK